MRYQNIKDNGIYKILVILLRKCFKFKKYFFQLINNFKNSISIIAIV
jgi:hypothetical protein